MTITMTAEEKTFGFRFKEWDIYKDARGFRKKVNQLVKNYPPEEKFALADQTKRALNSTVLNIAEGANKSTDKDTRIYINRAHTSLDEVVAALDCALDDKYINTDQHDELLLEASNLAKRLRSFTKYLQQ